MDLEFKQSVEHGLMQVWPLHVLVQMYMIKLDG